MPSASTTQSGEQRARLLEHLVHQHFGSAVGEVASILLARGALSFPQLAKLTALPPSLAQAALLALSTHTLLFHSETEVNGRLTELYELNHDAIERRLRGGLYVEMAAEWEGGTQLAAVTDALWREGILVREDLVHVVSDALIAARDNADGLALDDDPKGKKRARVADQGAFPPSFLPSLSRAQADLDAHPRTVADTADKLVRKAFAQGYLNVVTPGSQLSPSSLEIKWEEELRATIKGAPASATRGSAPQRLACRESGSR